MPSSTYISSAGEMEAILFSFNSGASRILLVAAVGITGLLMGCESMTSPVEAPNKYQELMQVAAAQGQARPDTSFFWLRNAGNARGRSLMIELGINYLHYDRRNGVLCMWSGEGLWPARGYVTSVPAGRPQTDSVGVLCDIEGECTATAVTETWAQFECG